MSKVATLPLSRPRHLRPALALALALSCFATGASAGELRPPQPRVQAVDHGTAPNAATPGRVAPELAKRLEAGGQQDFVIEMAQRADLSSAAAMDWQARGRFVVQQLKATADQSQAALRRELARAGARFETHWIKNVIVVRGGDAALLRKALRHPGVSRIVDLPTVALIRPQPGKAPAFKAGQTGIGIADNIAWIGADQAWAQGTRGHGVTVGVIDTGAYYTHSALRRQYRGWRGGGSYEHDYNWFAPDMPGGEPIGNDTHGSHVLGTILGDDHAADPALRNRIGVAPGAQWIACLGLTVDGNNAASLLSCGEFMLAPTRTDGSDPDPDQRPQVVNNSWSEQNCNGEATSFYADVVDAWVAAGIFPVFAAGNAFSCDLPEPAGLSTVSSPASLAAAFAVGSTGNHDGTYAEHSLWGPTSQPSPGLPLLPDTRGFPSLKPQVVAPGVDIVSVYDGFEDHYGSMTGTSMSAPHIAGLVALMLEAGECLRGNYPVLGTLIMSTARPLPYATLGDPAPGPGDVPNYATGWGEIDAPAAVNAAAAACGPQGFVSGRITATDGTPVAGALVELFVDENVRVWAQLSEPDGSYIRRLPEDAGAGYQVRVSAYGFFTTSQTGIDVSDGQTTEVDVMLEQAPLATVQGTVRDAATGWPLHARLRIAGWPDEALWTDPVDGAYQLQLPIGASYRVDLDSDIPGYAAQSQQLNVAGAMSRDFTLSADTTSCSAPGHTYAQQLAFEGFESGSPPAGWTLSSAGEGWRFGTHAELDQPSYWPIPARPGRFAATIDPAPETGNDGRVDYLVSPPIDLRTATRPVLRFASRFWSGSFLTRGAYVQASIDDGANWQPVGVPEQIADTWSDEAMSLEPFAGHIVRLRFHYDDGSSDDFDMVNPGWAIDDVTVSANCMAPAGGSLIVGHVRDANTGAALNGAVVSVGDASSVATTSADPAVGEGFFSLWSAAGSVAVSAQRGSQPQGYGDAQQVLAVGDGKTLTATLALPAGLLAFEPSEGPSAQLELGTVLNVPFTLRNDGGLPLDVAVEGMMLEEHFDGAMPPQGWSVTDNGLGCAWNLAPFGNSAGGDGNAAGVSPYDCWGSGRLDNSLLLPPIDLSQSSRVSLGFFLALHQGPESASTFDVEVSVNAGASWTSVFTEAGDTYAREPFNLVELDLSSHAGTPELLIRLRYQTLPPWGEVQVDQIHVFRQLGLDGPLSLTPDSATLAPGASLAAEARFDATAVAQPGTYAIPIRVVENTPYEHPFGTLSGSMIVTAPASWGALVGQVRSLGRCDATPQPLVDLPVQITAADGGQVITRTDAQGQYQYWFDAARGPFQVSLDAPGHAALEREASITAGNQTTLDLDARLLEPCVIPDPASLSINLNAGETIDRPFDLINLGAQSGDYVARVGGDPQVLTPVRVSQNHSSEPEPFATFACADPASGYTLENHWYRVFPLLERGLAGEQAWIDGVRFGADSTFSAAGAQAVTVSAYRLDGPFVRENLTLLAQVEYRVPDSALDMFEARFANPVQVTLDSTVVVELAVADGSDAASAFYPAGNQAGDSAPAWFAAEDCGLTEPMSFQDLGFENLSPIIELDLRASDACGITAQPVSWMNVTPASGNVPADGVTPLTAAIDAAGLSQGIHPGAICIGSGESDPTPRLMPVQLEIGEGPAEAIFADGFD